MGPLSDTTVLVAEDERSVRMLLRIVLEASGARVLEADDGVQALRVLALHPDTDLLCTDMNMPNLDGFGLIGEVRRRRPDLPIVACTAMDVANTGALVDAHVDACVQKPFVPADLVRAIGAALVPRSHARLAAAN